MRRGGQGDPAKPQLMKPQLYTFLQSDASHPSGNATSPCALVWLGEEVVAVCYEHGDIVAFALGY